MCVVASEIMVPQRHMHPELQRVTTFGRRVLESIKDLKKSDWCPSERKDRPGEDRRRTRVGPPGKEHQECPPEAERGYKLGFPSEPSEEPPADNLILTSWAPQL